MLSTFINSNIQLAALGVIGAIIILFAFTKYRYLLYLIFLLPLVEKTILQPIKIPVLNVLSSPSNFIVYILFVKGLVSHLVNRKPLAWNASISCLCLFVGWGMFSYIWSAIPSETVSKSVQWIIYVGAYAVFLDVFSKEMNINRVMYVFALTGCVFVIAGLLQLPGVIQSGTRLAALRGQPNGFASYVILGLLGVFWFAEENPKKRIYRTIRTVYIVFGIICILFSGSRGGLISLAIFFLLFGLFSGRKYIGITGAIALIVLWFVFPSAFSTIRNRMDNDSDGLGGRSRLYTEAITMIKQRPLTGLGLGTYQKYLAEAAGYGNPKSVHNPVLAVSLDLGVPGALCYLLFLFLPLIGYLRSNIDRIFNKNLPPTPIQAKLIFSYFMAYLVDWIKSGGSEGNYYIFAFLAIMITYTSKMQTRYPCKSLITGDENKSSLRLAIE